MADIKIIDGFHVATFVEDKILDIDEFRTTVDTKVFTKDGTRVGFFREVTFVHFDGTGDVHHIMEQPHPIFEKLGMEGDKTERVVFFDV